jgi:hypothetical protein
MISPMENTPGAPQAETASGERDSPVIPQLVGCARCTQLQPRVIIVSIRLLHDDLRRKTGPRANENPDICSDAEVEIRIKLSHVARPDPGTG